MSVPDGEHSVVKIVSALAIVSNYSSFVELEHRLVSLDGNGVRLLVNGRNQGSSVVGRQFLLSYDAVVDDFRFVVSDALVV